MPTNKRSKRSRQPKLQQQQYQQSNDDDDELSASEKRVHGNATIGCTLILAYYIGWPDSFIWYIAFLPTVLIFGKILAYLSLMTCGILYAVYIKYIRKLPVSPDGTLFIDETYAILYPDSKEAREVARRRTCEIDHLVYTCSDLDDGIDYIKKLTGVKPAYGGQHSAYGTHNALLSLGNGSYLELIAADPNRKDVNQTPSIFELDDDTLDDRLATFAVHHNTSVKGSTFELIAQELCLEGCKIGAIESGERQAPNGTLLQWKFTDPYRAKQTQPFVIDWGTSKSPAYTSPSGCKSRLIIQGANVDEIGKLGDTLSKIGLLGAENIPISFETSNDGSSCLVAEIITPKGKKVYLGDTKVKET